MSYEPTTWKSGDTVTSAKLNKMEQGIANAGGGGVLIVHDVDSTLDKTWQEIHDAILSVGAVVEVNNGGITLFTFAGTDGAGTYHVDTAIGDEYYTDSTDGYPATREYDGAYA